MITSPTIDQILEGVIISLADDIMPSIENPKAAANCLMVQSLLQGVRQLLTVIDDQLVDEHNDMIAVLRRSAEALTDNSAAAQRMRERTESVCDRDPLPAPMDRAAALAAHNELTHAIEESMRDLDEMLTAGDNSAHDALLIIREHLGQRYLRDVTSIQVGEGFIGRS